MPPILMRPHNTINDNFSRFQYQQLSLQRGSRICMELMRIEPHRVKITVHGPKKKRVEGRSNCYRVQCSVALKGGYRVLSHIMQLPAPGQEEWIPFAGLQQLTPRRSCIVNIHSKCTTECIGLPSRQPQFSGLFEVRTMRMEVMVQIKSPTGWRRHAAATQVGYTWCMAHLAWVFGRDRPWLLGKKLQRMVLRPLPAAAAAAAAAAAPAPVPQAGAQAAPPVQNPAAPAAHDPAAAQPPADDPAAAQPPAHDPAAPQPLVPQPAGGADGVALDDHDDDSNVSSGGLSDSDEDDGYADD